MSSDDGVGGCDDKETIVVEYLSRNTVMKITTTVRSTWETRRTEV